LQRSREQQGHKSFHIHSFLIRRHIHIFHIHLSSHIVPLDVVALYGSAFSSLFAIHHGLEHLVDGRFLATTAFGCALNAVAGANALGHDIFMARQGRSGLAAQALLRRATQRAGRNQANITTVTSQHATFVRFRRDETDAARFGAHGHAAVLTDAQTVASTDHEEDNIVKVAHIVAAATRVTDAARAFIVRHDDPSAVVRSDWLF
jgi:hypothetical protein